MISAYISGMAAVRYFSMTNPWIDFVVLAPKENLNCVITDVEQAMDDFWDYEYETYGDAVDDALLNDSRVNNYIVLYGPSDEEDTDASNSWEAMLDELHRATVVTTLH